MYEKTHYIISIGLFRRNQMQLRKLAEQNFRLKCVLCRLMLGFESHCFYRSWISFTPSVCSYAALAPEKSATQMSFRDSLIGLYSIRRNGNMQEFDFL